MNDRTQLSGVEARLLTYVRIIEEEIPRMTTAVADAEARQWEASPVPKPREDTTERSSGGRPANPTADTALDARRLDVREAYDAARATLRQTAIALRASRLTIERSVSRFDGEGS